MGATEIMVVAGEASGDQHAAALVGELRRRRPELRFFGMGGASLEREGLERLYDAQEISVMGITDVLPKIPRILRVMRGLEDAARARRPALAVLVDIPDFNLRLARKLKRLGIRVAYYISPTVWAWRPGRAKQIARDVDEMLCILPFEAPWYEERGVRAKFVGSPVLDHLPQPGPKEAFRASLGLDAARPTLGLLPGSRMGEISRILPDMVGAAKALSAQTPGLQVVVPVAPTISREEIVRRFEGSGVTPVLVDGRAPEVVGASDVAVVTSGTATLEAGLMQRPLVVVYRASALTWIIGRLLVKVAHVSLVNLLAGRALVPELLQKDLSPERIVAEVRRLWTGGERDLVVRGLEQMRQTLGEAGASRRAADAVLELLDGQGACAISAAP